MSIGAVAPNIVSPVAGQRRSPTALSVVKGRKLQMPRLSIKKERQEMLGYLAQEQAKKKPDKDRLRLIKDRINCIDLVEATRKDDCGFRWMLETVEYSDVLKQDTKCLIELQAGNQDAAEKEALKILQKETDRKKLKRARLYYVHLEKQFRKDEIQGDQ